METRDGVTESVQSFESRKSDHIDYSIDSRSQVKGSSQFNSIQFIHDALPEMNFSEVDISSEVFGKSLKTPFFVSSMTAGHNGAGAINSQLAQVCEKRGWFMGVGSQRRELFDDQAFKEWTNLRDKTPEVLLVGNLGLAQVIQTSVAKIKKLLDSMGALALFVHLNPLQEVIQEEGTPQFKGGVEALERLVNELDYPVVLKEVGCGLSTATLEKIRSLSLAAVDVSGYGGTHWGRIEGLRAKESRSQVLGETFRHWGVPTVECLRNYKEASFTWPVWASGGVRDGLQGAKLLAVGAEKVGFAQPLLKAVMKSTEVLDETMSQLEEELKTTLFCTGCKNLEELKSKKVYRWVN